VASFPIALSGHYVPWPRGVVRAKTAANKIHLLRSSHSFAMLRCSALAAAIAAPAKRELGFAGSRAARANALRVSVNLDFGFTQPRAHFR
jgi:hypothetical protein